MPERFSALRARMSPERREANERATGEELRALVYREGVFLEQSLRKNIQQDKVELVRRMYLEGEDPDEGFIITVTVCRGKSPKIQVGWWNHGNSGAPAAWPLDLLPWILKTVQEAVPTQAQSISCFEASNSVKEASSSDEAGEPDLEEFSFDTG
jgi:hypothetical protein